MKKFIEYKYEMASVDGKRAWINPVATGKEPVMDEHQAQTINDQFVNTGVKLELKEEVPAEETATEETSELVDHVVTEEDLAANPELAESGVKVGDTIQIKPETKAE